MAEIAHLPLGTDLSRMRDQTFRLAGIRHCPLLWLDRLLHREADTMSDYDLAHRYIYRLWRRLERPCGRACYRIRPTRHWRSFLEEAEIVDVGGPVGIRPRRAIAGKSRERIAADFLLVDDADIRTRSDLRLDLFLLDRGAGMRSAIWKRNALAPLRPDALLSEHAGTHHQCRQNHQASHSCPPAHGRPAIGPRHDPTFQIG